MPKKSTVYNGVQWKPAVLDSVVVMTLLVVVGVVAATVLLVILTFNTHANARALVHVDILHTHVIHT